MAAQLQVKKRHQPVQSGSALRWLMYGGPFVGAFVLVGLSLHTRSEGKPQAPMPQAAVRPAPESGAALRPSEEERMVAPLDPVEVTAPRRQQPAQKSALPGDVQIVQQRLEKRTEQDLVKQLAGIPEVRVDEDSVLAWDVHRPAMPKQRGKILDAGQAASVVALAQALRNGTATDQRLQELGAEVDGTTMCSTMCQVLQAEVGLRRTFMVQQLERHIIGSSTAILAERALFDPAPSVRAQAVAALKQRPPEAYRQILLDGFQYPWPPVADHAAQALVALQDTESVGALKKLLEAPDPARPFLHAPTSTYQVRELVKVNHLCGCLLCHIPSTSTLDPLRSPIPIPGQALPVEYYRSREPSRFQFTDASTILIRQDFSVMQEAPERKPWPSRQRFDFLVRTRPATPSELARVQQLPKSSDYPQQQAIRYAIFHLSGQADEPVMTDKTKTVALPQSR